MLYNAVGYLKQCSYKMWSKLNTTGTKDLARSLQGECAEDDSFDCKCKQDFWRKKLKKISILLLLVSNLRTWEESSLFNVVAHELFRGNCGLLR